MSGHVNHSREEQFVVSQEPSAVFSLLLFDDRVFVDDRLCHRFVLFARRRFPFGFCRISFRAVDIASRHPRGEEFLQRENRFDFPSLFFFFFFSFSRLFSRRHSLREVHDIIVVVVVLFWRRWCRSREQNGEKRGRVVQFRRVRVEPDAQFANSSRVAPKRKKLLGVDERRARRRCLLLLLLLLHVRSMRKRFRFIMRHLEPNDDVDFF